MSKKKTSKKAMTEVQDKMPAWLQNKGSNRGSEEVQAEDLIIPRLELAQAISPAQKKKDDAYIDGCEEGMMYNNITRELYGESVIICPVFYKKEWLLWRDRKDDKGGFHGAYPSKAEAEAARKELERPEKVEAVDTGQHFCLVIKNDGSIDEIVVSMARSKAKVSRIWNSLIRINGGDRFSRLYKLETITDQNNSGDQFANFKVSNYGFVSEEIYQQAEVLYDAVKSGVASVDRSIDENSPEEDNEEY